MFARHTSKGPGTRRAKVRTPGSALLDWSMIHIHADESCLGNQFKNRQRPGGAAGLLEFWRDDAWVRKDFWLSEPDTTNNRMALMSAVAGLGAIRRPSRIRFVSDSQYLVRGMNEWIRGWRARGWKRKGGVVENVELWKRVADLAESHEVGWKWVRGHSGNPRNEYVHTLAVRAATGQLDSGGAVSSGFGDWLEKERETKRRYLDFFEGAPPGDRN